METVACLGRDFRAEVGVAAIQLCKFFELTDVIAVFNVSDGLFDHKPAE